MKEKILIVDDDESLRWVLQKAFEKSGYDVSVAPKGEEGLHLLEMESYGVAFVDIMMPDMSGLDLLKRVKEGKLGTSVVIMTAQNTMKNAVEAMKRGAFDYVTKPFDMDEVKAIAGRALESVSLSEKAAAGRGASKETYEVGTSIIGISHAMQKVYKMIGKISGSDVTVLIQGESGTGKELIARAIHSNSERGDKPFVAVNSAAIPKDLLESELFGHEKGAFTGATERKTGKFELAEGGTLFLDEIGDMGLELQMKLLRALQEREIDRVGGSKPVQVDVRVIAATHQDLAKAVKAKQFREDLYYRLNVVMLKLPPLRKRKEDIPLLADYFMSRFAGESEGNERSISDEAMRVLAGYEWPGNVRELENVMRRMLVLSASSTILPTDLPSKLKNAANGERRNYDNLSLEEILRIKLAPLIQAVDEENTEGLYDMVLTQLERPLIRLVLEKCRWNQIKAARVLGINRNTLKKKMSLLDIQRPKR